MSDGKRRRRGRPTGKESLDTHKEIAKLYLQNASPVFIIQETGFGKDTVYAEYNAILEIAREQDKKDFTEKYEQKKIQYILSMDNLINKTYKILDYTELCMKKYRGKEKEIPDYLTQKFSELTKNIVSMQKEKASKELQIPLDEQLRAIIVEEVAKEVEKNGNRRH